MILGWLFSVILFLLVLLAVCVLITLFAIVGRKEDPLLTIPHYLQERFQSFFEQGIVAGILKSLFFFAFISVVPFVLTLYCITLFPKVYTITNEDGTPVKTWYMTASKKLVHEGEVIAVDRKMVYIFNDTNKDFCLCSSRYSSVPHYDETTPEFYLISSHAYLETEHKPDFWFRIPEKISVQVSKTGRSNQVTVTRWLVLPLDPDAVNP